MHYVSTNNPQQRVDLREAVLRALPPDNGLYVPERIPTLDAATWRELRGQSLETVGQAMATAFFGDDVPANTLRAIVADAISFHAPLVSLDERTHVLELFHGPTLAFKDFGARFMARLMAHLTADDEQPLTVLVATSGDTGGAVASAFHGVVGTRVVILYPTGRVSGLQERQLTTAGDNITALEVAGTFDDCQRMVKAAFLDVGLSRALNLTSANSINISRLVPQGFYFAHAAGQLDAPPVFVVPSGNFGNLTAGVLAERMGLPVKHFVAATNRNDVVPEYLLTGTYRPRPAEATISNAMDVGAPSNFARLQHLFPDVTAMRERIAAFAFDDDATRDAIRQVHRETGTTLDPHGAVGWLAAMRWRDEHPDDHDDHVVILETAHPSKFPAVIEAELGADAIEVPERLACLRDRPKVATSMAADMDAFLGWLRDHY